MEVIYHKVTENQRDKQIYSVKNQVVCHLFNAIKLQRFYDIAIPVSGGVLTHGDSACPFNEERVANKSLYFAAVALFFGAKIFQIAIFYLILRRNHFSCKEKFRFNKGLCAYIKSVYY